MTQKDNGVQCFFRLPGSLVTVFDNCRGRLGYTSRAELFTALAYGVMDKDAERADALMSQPALDMRDLIRSGGNLSSQQIFRRLCGVIGDLAMPVVAVRGVDTAYDAVRFDVRDAFFEKYGIRLTDDELREGFTQYELLNKKKLRDYAYSMQARQDEDVGEEN